MRFGGRAATIPSSVSGMEIDRLPAKVGVVSVKFGQAIKV